MIRIKVKLHGITIRIMYIFIPKGSIPGLDAINNRVTSKIADRQYI